jgi:phenylacetate-coenzyme A ligase PaaK-like adenylate-forming protein
MNSSTTTERSLADCIEIARAALDEHVRQIVRWHFSPETGCPHWLSWARHAGWNPIAEVGGFDDLLRFPNFDGELLRALPHEQFVPAAFRGRPFHIFETGGTTGMPKQRIQWNDYKIDYEQFSETLDDDAFPRNEYWLMIGPTGPRRLRLAIEHLANVRGCSCYFVDLDPRWVKKVIVEKRGDEAKRYMTHVVDQAMSILQHRKVSALFTTPRLLEALGERMSIPDAGIRGVFCGGTEMSPQYTRFLIEEILENRTRLVPTYGNTLMGLAHHRPLTREDKYSITYHAPQPRAVMRVVDAEDPHRAVEYEHWGRVELTTLTQEFFMPRFLERDEAIRRRPCEAYPWDGVGEVRPFRAMQESIVEGVY